jgi:hypothetical protein
MRTFHDGDLTVLDIASFLAATSPIELEVYTIALARVPVAFLDREQLGIMRRPGVLWVDGGTHARVENEIRRRMTSDSSYPAWLGRRFAASCNVLARACADASLPPESPAGVWLGLADVMPFLAFNWLLPRDELGDQVRARTGLDGEELEAWLVAASAPSRPPHFLRFRRELLLLARAHVVGERVDCATFARTMGKLQNSLIDPAPLENASAVADEVARLATELGSVVRIDAELAQLEVARRVALERRKAALTDARCRAADAEWPRLAAVAALLQLAADEEEERHVLQMQALTVLRLAAEQRAVPLPNCTSAALGLPELVADRPRLAA